MNYKLKYLIVKATVFSVISITLIVLGIIAIGNHQINEDLIPFTRELTILGITFPIQDFTVHQKINFDTLISGCAIAILGIWLFPFTSLRKIKDEVSSNKIEKGR